MMEISTLTPNMEILHDGRLDHRNPTMRRHSAFASSDRAVVAVAAYLQVCH